MKRRRLSTSALASTRAKLKLTQEEMAMRLGTSLSMIKLVETKRRSLPTAILLKLIEIERELVNNAANQVL